MRVEARLGYFRLLKSHKVQKYVRPDRKTRRQMEIVIVGVLGEREGGEGQ